MKHIATAAKNSLFKVLLESDKVQAAMMSLRPGESSSAKVENEHPKSEQWLYVISGSGRATAGHRSKTIRAGSLLLIETGEPHRITNTGRRSLATINFYAPPAYTHKGNVKRAIAR